MKFGTLRIECGINIIIPGTRRRGVIVNAGWVVVLIKFGSLDPLWCQILGDVKLGRKTQKRYKNEILRIGSPGVEIVQGPCGSLLRTTQASQIPCIAPLPQQQKKKQRFPL